MISRLLPICLTAFTLCGTPGSASQETETVPESYIFLLPPAQIMTAPSGQEKLANKFRPDLMSPVFLVYRTGSRRENSERQWQSSFYYGVSFNIAKDFPKDAPEIACIIHRYGDSLYHEEIFFFQRMVKNPDSRRKIFHVDLNDSFMP
ncbi:hypothetical protein [Akkermansia sp.]|uniref:hypothetical protein n=1 Tax=Akkermansia sp. TaxID=1872421 RepID=UPI003AABEDD9